MAAGMLVAVCDSFHAKELSSCQRYYWDLSWENPLYHKKSEVYKFITSYSEMMRLHVVAIAIA